MPPRNWTLEQRRAYHREWIARRRIRFFEDKACAECGSEELLELHHRDPDQKISHRIWSWSAERRELEVAKCEVLCGDCHQNATNEQRRAKAEKRNPCGTNGSYCRGCRCGACCAAHADTYGPRQLSLLFGKRGTGHEVAA